MPTSRIVEDSKNIGDPINSRRINNKIDLINQKMDSLYKDIYISRTDDRRNLDDIIDGLDSALDKLQSTDLTVAGMSELMRRIDKKQNTAANQLMDSVTDLFSDQSLIGILAANDSIHRYLAAENYTYDLICKYLPKLKLALEIKRDNVLCSDNFSKEFINPQSNKSAKDEAQRFSINTKKLERKYQFSDFLDKTYMNISKYGEDFIYIVPYYIAFKRIINRTNKRAMTGNIYAGNLNVLGESFGYDQHSLEVVSEGYTASKEFTEFLEAVSLEDQTLYNDFVKNNKVEGAGVNLYFNDTGMIQSSVHEYTTLYETSQLDKFKSLSSIYESTSIKEESDLEKKYKKVKDNNDGLTKATKNIYSDGLIVPNSLAARDPEKIDKNFTGAVVERIPRENIIPVYMGDVCFGYYHLEFGKDPTACGYCGAHHTGMPGLSNSTAYARETDEKQEELMLRFISARISNAIDSHFINANKDLKEEIYAILHYNEQFDISRTNNIGVTFIPADDIIHCYFEQDEYTHRGISDLKDSIVPAMLYILLYLTDIIGKITRSTDKRVYYVKQNVEQNIARTMMNVVKQIKKGNMGMRQIESMNNILNIVGKYNDYIIPQGPSGDPPIQFEIMPGQDIQTPSEIMDKMEEAAINPIMPYEFINSVMQQDFATRFTMSNSRFLRTIFTRQNKTEIFASKMYTKIYNYEYDEHYQEITIVLPPPTYMVLQNNSQLLDNVQSMAEKISMTYLEGESDEIKAEFNKLYVRDALSTYIDYDKVERFIQAAKVNVIANTSAATDDGSESDQYM